ncbi:MULTISPECIES: ribulose-phosphate 3-epimerase [Campylobacter]|jgi:ribulose-phosphate 3-epimerase|uniref:Ribulose-phosphate 3-epimerase n=2 Tax=Campylobacter concisus TaxID=199 RepID=A0A1Y5N919_9BACT|nr:MULTISPECIES: ribulose-phosphate 3-epimerase [Campylobacter]AVX43977.1 Ribulose-phosphate 3-epimerase [Campylobacter concisus]EHL91144.1 ribulose-phosphate 3-epimerase [Campylobacter sp. 10_1_50]ERJ21039.1 Ribulose-phosphate 3-epimerase [Campylobacter concisus UNSW3]ERJ29166.1 Ribulose-phosphate 3-epimerase [Campylobacter concisus ATCC 51561]MBF0928911.1 ribulose-phosphate 3-epimerase [Campylobacter concisus]
MYVAPSILSADFGNLAAEIRAICEAGCDLVHVDVMDGHFVPNLTIGPVVVSAVAKAATKPLDIHLMVENNSFFADLFLPLKPKFLTFHIEEEKHPMRLIDHIRKNGVSPGIVLNPHTPVSAIEHIIDEVDMVLLMSVNPGFGGQKFMPVVLEKTRALRELIERKNAKCLIEVDGGVNGLNAPDLEEAGADVLVAGSYIFSSNSYEQAIRAIKLEF